MIHQVSNTNVQGAVSQGLNLELAAKLSGLGVGSQKLVEDGHSAKMHAPHSAEYRLSQALS